MRYLYLVIAVQMMVGCGGEASSTQTEPATNVALIKQLDEATINPISIEDVSRIFVLGSEYTDLQRDKNHKALVGSYVEWALSVYEVKLEDGAYKVMALPKSSSGQTLLPTVIFVTPRNDQDRAVIESLKTNDTIVFKGKVSDIKMRSLVVINPAILRPNLGSNTTKVYGVEKWLSVGSNKALGVTTYVQSTSIKRQDGMSSIWRLDSYETLENGFMSSMYLSEYDCRADQTRTLADNYYSGPMGTGVPVRIDNNPTQWVPVAPHSIGEAVMEIACGH